MHPFNPEAERLVQRLMMLKISPLLVVSRICFSADAEQKAFVGIGSIAVNRSRSWVWLSLVKKTLGPQIFLVED